MTVTIDGTLGITTPAATVSGALSAASETFTATPVVTSPSASQIILGTAQATTSGTAILFTGIPSWARRVTVNFKGVGTSGTSVKQIQLGSGSVTTTGYGGGSAAFAAATLGAIQSTTGAAIYSAVASDRIAGSVVFALENASTNTWCWQGSLGFSTGTSYLLTTGGSIALSGALDRINITTVNGTDTFAAGEINVMWE